MDATASAPRPSEYRKEPLMPKPEHHVLVCVNSRPADHPKGSCEVAGGQAVFETLRDAVREAGLDGHVMVSRTRCLKHCSRGVVAAVYPDNVWYAKVEARDAAEICETHLRGGRAVERLLMPDIPWE